MPQIEISSSKGLVQKTGEGLILTPATISAPAAAAAGSTNTLAQAAMTFVSNATNGNDRVYLPDPSDVAQGQIIRLFAVEDFELSAKGVSTTINGTGVSDGNGAYAAELDVAANSLLECIRVSSTAWIVVKPASAGTPDA